MPIYEGANIIDRVKTGLAVITSAYVGVDKVFGYDPTQVLDLTSQEDFNFATWLNAQGVDAANPVIVNFADGQIIGGVDAPAFTVGDISAYSNITFNVSGQIQGAVGGNAVASASPMNIVLNGGTISGAIEEGIQSGSANITFSVNTTGKILAGGGNGGNGGKGGTGESADWHSNFTYFTSDGKVQSGWGTSPDMSVWWGGAPWHVYNGSPGWVIWKIDAPGTANMWQRGANADGHWYYLRYGLNRIGVGGAGGSGGTGIGYNATRTDGALGGTGTWRSGDGGRGGDGGDWGVAGGTGNQGGTGLFYSTTNPDATRFGASGIVGGSAGVAITSTSAVRIF